MVIWIPTSAVGAEMEEELGGSDTILECCGVFKVSVVNLIDSLFNEFCGSFLCSSEGGVVGMAGVVGSLHPVADKRSCGMVRV